MVLTNMPRKVAEIIADEMVYGICDYCGNEGLIRKFDDYLIESEEGCENCIYFEMYKESFEYNRGIPANILKIKSICWNCLGELQYNMMDDMEGNK